MVKIGFVITSSYCTFHQIIDQILLLQESGYDIYPIASENALGFDTRAGKAEMWKEKIETITGKKVTNTIVAAEKFGPREKLDLIVIAPATGNFVAKLANGITDTAALMATKATLRNGSPAVIGVSTNDGLGINGENIFKLVKTKNIYFVPFGQDDYENKPNSLISHYDLILPTIEEALEGKQLQPVLQEYQKKLVKGKK